MHDLIVVHSQVEIIESDDVFWVFRTRPHHGEHWVADDHRFLNFRVDHSAGCCHFRSGVLDERRAWVILSGNNKTRNVVGMFRLVLERD